LILKDNDLGACIATSLGKEIDTMTKRETVAAIRALNMTAKWSSEWQEFIVDYPLHDSRRTKNSSYHTDNAYDALGTARIMLQSPLESGEI
jgi:hypothetical protein